MLVTAACKDANITSDAEVPVVAAEATLRRQRHRHCDTDLARPSSIDRVHVLCSNRVQTHGVALPCPWRTIVHTQRAVTCYVALRRASASERGSPGQPRGRDRPIGARKGHRSVASGRPRGGGRLRRGGLPPVMGATSPAGGGGEARWRILSGVGGKFWAAICCGWAEKERKKAKESTPLVPCAGGAGSTCLTGYGTRPGVSAKTRVNILSVPGVGGGADAARHIGGAGQREGAAGIARQATAVWPTAGPRCPQLASKPCPSSRTVRAPAAALVKLELGSSRVSARRRRQPPAACVAPPPCRPAAARPAVKPTRLQKAPT
eukprot:102015-Chlamydomonas_euryale.AAC.2